MTDRFAFTVKGDPVPAVRMTQKSKWIDPQAKRYLAWKDAVGWAARAHGAEVMDGRLEVRMWFYLGTRRRRDWDNLAKAVCDGLNGICYRDDSQVDRAIVAIYTGHPNEFVDVEIRQMAHEESRD